MKNISLDSYKGVRDFYPDENRLHRFIFETWEKTAESWGFEKYDASVLEPLELYKSKSSEEIVNEQIYSFTDRGGREVALRPEMTPTVARMIAGKANEIPMPARWYSIPNLFRYEKPQRGRLREHWQLNADIFGSKSAEAEAEIITLASDIMKNFGAKETDYQIRINSREIFSDLYKKMGIPEEKTQVISRIIDKKDKIQKDAFVEALKEVISEEQIQKLSYIFDSGEQFFEEFKENKSVQNLKDLIESLRKRGMTNVVFSPTLTRGFDYYTGTVFEVFDTNPENSRSLFGGGRYDDLIGSLSGTDLPAVGFGMGDVTIEDFLNTHNLLPNLKSSTDLWICVALETSIEEVEKIAKELREKGVNVGVDISGKKLPDQLKSLDKRNVAYVMVVGKDELESGKFKIRNTETREEKEGSLAEITETLCAK